MLRCENTKNAATCGAPAVDSLVVWRRQHGRPAWIQWLCADCARELQLKLPDMQARPYTEYQLGGVGPWAQEERARLEHEQGPLYPDA